MAETHAQTMDRTYRLMKHVYDATRPFFLAGRRALRQRAAALAPAHAAEFGCGTGRNLILLARALPKARFTGIDISREMLAFARGKVEAAGVGGRINLSLGDAASALIDPPADIIVFSYSLSMIPDWQAALANAALALAPGGTILIADFSTMEAWPSWPRERLRKNLAWYHVTPRYGLEEHLRQSPWRQGWRISRTSLFGGYAALFELSKP